MLLKLFRHNIQVTYKKFSLIFILIITGAFIGSLSVQILGLDLTTVRLSLAILILLSVIYGYIIILLDYVDSLFGKTAYVTNAIPASKTELLISKTMAGMFWQNVLLLAVLSANSIFSEGDGLSFGAIFWLIEGLFEPLHYMHVRALPLLIKTLTDFGAIFAIFNMAYFCILQSLFLAYTICNISLDNIKIDKYAALISVIIFVHVQIIIAYMISKIVNITIPLDYSLGILNGYNISKTCNITFILIFLLFSFTSYLVNIYMQENHTSVTA